nr:hypothetical protein [Tanacetum cinerariifolium]
EAVESRATARRGTFLKRRVVHYHPVDDKQRLVVAIERSTTPNDDAGALAWPAARRSDVDARHFALQRIDNVGLARVDDVLAGYFLHGRHKV